MAEHPKYKIIERVDAGGMAEVFRGVAESLQGFKKSVAIKRILPNLCKNRKFISMFLDEARLSLHLQHANIVAMFDIGMSPPEPGSADNAYFIVMEYVDGSHLKGILEYLRRHGQQMPVAQVLYIVMEVCKGLAYAHDITDPETNRPLGIVHRDISPPNILISKMGEVKLVDFGLAKANSQLESTEPGMVKGKFSYLSPEAAQGRDVDRRADIFAVGILMYELLTGKRLFYGETDYHTVELVRQARVPPIAPQNPDVEPELEAVVRKALSRDLNQRFQTAGELQDAIAQYLFSRSLKVTSRDIAQLVRNTLQERQTKAAPKQKAMIDTMIREEMIKFTSIEDKAASQSSSGAQPLSLDDLSGAMPLDSGSFVDTRSWTEEVALDDHDAPPTIVDNGELLSRLEAEGQYAPSPSINGQAAAAIPAEALARRADESLQLLTPGVPAAVVGEASSARAAGSAGTAGTDRALGLWIALGAILLLGGGAIVFLVMALGHHR